MTRVAVVVLATIAIAACDSATNLDVAYEKPDATTPPPTCSCDAPSVCCLGPHIQPFCTTSETQCTAAGGAYLECVRPTSDSSCCWHGTIGGRGSSAQLGTYCGTSACNKPSDCESGQCSTVTCGGVVLGACGSIAPVCP